MAWLFALLRCLFPRDPVKQAVEGARHAVSLLVQQVANAEALEVLKNDPAARAYIEAIINDYEAVVRLAIGMRACQIAGIRFNSAARAFHIPARTNSLSYIFRRIQALVYLSKDIERHAQSLAIRLRREHDADPLAAHGSTDAARCAAAHHEAVGVALHSSESPIGLILSLSKDEAVLTALATSSGPPHSIVATDPQPALQASPARSRAHACWPPPNRGNVRPMSARPTFLEFFAGGGMARAGLDGLIDCAFANDIDPMKCAAYRANHPDDPIVQGDIWNLRPADIPSAALAWASFPCQDLSLAGGRRGLNAPRSGAFWGFWNIIERQGEAAPKTIVIENVAGLLSSHGGRDLATLLTTLADAGYRVGAMLIDAALFSPQSRQRLFIIAHKGKLPDGLVADQPDDIFHPPALRAAVANLPDQTHMAWVWWRLPHPPRRNTDLATLLERNPPESVWRSDVDTQRLLTQMAPLHRQRVDAALADPNWNAGAVYRRIRIENGKRIQRAEIRYDGLAGCLRTPAGGSSKQLLLVTQNGRVRLRPLLAREAARLMGLSDSYTLPKSETNALKVMGDGVSVPVVRWLGLNLLAPLAGGKGARAAA